MKTNKSFLGVAILIPLLFSIMGCVRSARTSSSSLSIAVPEKVQGMAVLQLEHVVINVSGPGIPSPILFSWDGCKSCDVKPTPPSSFRLDVPQGSGRIVQVLTVYSQDTGGSVFYYGDNYSKPANFDLPDVSVEIPISSVTTATSLTSGMISGRYLDFTRFPAGGPTGKLSIMYTPPGKRPMVVTKTAIFAGWFNAFGLKEIPFDYVLEDGTSLTNGPITLDNLSINTSVIRIERPQSVSRMSYGGGQVGSNTREAKIFYAGYFGPGVGTRRACYLSPARYQNFSGLFDSSATTHLTYSAGAPGTSSVSVSGGAICTNADLINSQSEEFKSYLAFRPSAMGGYSWGETPFGFYSIFMGNIVNNIEGQVLPFQMRRSPASHDTIMQFKVLPGVNSTILDGIRVLKRVVPVGQPGFRGEDDLPCDAMFDGRISGFTAVSELAMPADTTNQNFSLTLPMHATEYGMAEFAICPFKAGRHLGGIFMRKDNFSNHGGNGVPELHINTGRMMTGMGTFFYYKETCVPLYIFKTNATGPVVQTSPVTVNLSVTTSGPGSATIKSDDTCSTNLSFIDIPAGQSTATAYLRLEASTEGTEITINATSDDGLAKTLHLHLLPGAATPPPRVPTITANVGSFDSLCSDYDVVLTDPFLGATTRGTASSSFSLSVSSPNTAELRTDCSLTGAPASPSTIAFSYSNTNRNITDSFARFSLRTIDTTRETELKFNEIGSSRVTYAVMNSQITNLFFEGLRPKVWLRAGSNYLPNNGVGGGLPSPPNPGWMSRVNGIEFLLANVTLDSDNNSYPYVAFNSASKAYRSGFGQSLMNYGSMSGLILLKRDANGRLLSAWNGANHPSDTAAGDAFSLTYENNAGNASLSAHVAANGSAGVASSGVPADGAAHVVAFKRVRTLNPSPTPGGSDSLSVSVNRSTWSATSKTFSSGAPEISYIHFGDVSQAFQGKIYEAVLFEGALTDAQMETVYKYWKARYPGLGLP